MEKSTDKTEKDSPSPDQGQGIVRDDNGQDQPNDRQRAQHVHTADRSLHRGLKDAK
jgi:hypothetical protein